MRIISVRVPGVSSRKIIYNKSFDDSPEKKELHEVLEKIKLFFLRKKTLKNIFIEISVTGGKIGKISQYFEQTISDIDCDDLKNLIEYLNDYMKKLERLKNEIIENSLSQVWFYLEISCFYLKSVASTLDQRYINYHTESFSEIFNKKYEKIEEAKKELLSDQIVNSLGILNNNKERPVYEFFFWAEHRDNNVISRSYEKLNKFFEEAEKQFELNKLFDWEDQPTFTIKILKKNLNVPRLELLSYIHVLKNRIEIPFEVLEDHLNLIYLRKVKRKSQTLENLQNAKKKRVDN